LNSNFIHSRGWFSGYDGKRVNYNIVTGWDAASEKIVQWFSYSDGGNSQRVGTFDPTTKLWTSTEKGVDADGKSFSLDVVIQFDEPDSWSWKGRNSQGVEPQPDLDFTFTRVTPVAAETRQAWIKYLAGEWTTTDKDGHTADESVETGSDGKALVSRGKFADGVEYVRQVGWEADSNTLVETWYTSSGASVVNRYRNIGEQKIVGNTTLSDGEGRPGKGTITREKVSENELKSVYRGTLPGETEKSVLTWISKRK
jgi:hypothetical protein